MLLLLLNPQVEGLIFCDAGEKWGLSEDSFFLVELALDYHSLVYHLYFD